MPYNSFMFIVNPFESSNLKDYDMQQILLEIIYIKFHCNKLTVSIYDEIQL